jgi:predicted GTPase
MQNGNITEKNTQHQSQDQEELNEAIRLLTETHNNIHSAIGKNIILLAGSTGAGKSTTIHLLLGHDFEEVEISNSDNKTDNSREDLAADFEVEILDEEPTSIATERTKMKGKTASREQPKLYHTVRKRYQKNWR